MARTFADLIRTVSMNIGDLYEGTLSDDGTFYVSYDAAHIEGDGWWVGGELSFTTGTNAGLGRAITGWLKASSQFIHDGFPNETVFGDQYQVRRRPKHTIAAVKEFINQAVREIERQSWVAVDSVVDLADDTKYYYGQQQYAVPTSIEMVHKVMYQDTDDPWSGSTTSGGTTITAPWVELDQTHWTTNKDGTILIQPIDDYADWDRSPITIPDAAPLKFLGSKRPSEFVNLTDTNPYEGNYLEVYATARLCLRLQEGAQDETDFGTKFKFWYGLENDAFRGTRRGLPSGSRKVR